MNIKNVHAPSEEKIVLISIVNTKLTKSQKMKSEVNYNFEQKYIIKV